MKLKRMIALGAALLFLSASVTAQQTVRVACIGNSITVGVGAADRASQNYPVVLGKLLGDGYEVKNFGASGYTLLKHGDRPYRNHKYFQESQDFAPDIVVVKLGTNDTKPMNWDKYSAEFESDLREFVELYRNLPSHPKIYLCYPVWVVDDRMTIRESILAQYVIPIIARVARELNVSTIDLHQTLYGMPQLIPDGVHPNELGYVLIARDVYERIK